MMVMLRVTAATDRFPRGALEVCWNAAFQAQKKRVVRIFLTTRFYRMASPVGFEPALLG